MKRTSALFARLALVGSGLLLAACSKDRDPVAAGPAYQPHPTTASSSQYISRVFEYQPAPGQFVNDANYGTPAKAQTLVGSIDNGLVSLGAYGGYVVFGFDHSIANRTGADLGIYGNPLYSLGAEWAEPGIVQVMQDLNGNNLPDDGEWYELAGSEYAHPTTRKKYRIAYYNPKNFTSDIAWRDNQGQRGAVLRNSFHRQAYYPNFAANQDSLVFEGTLLRNTLLPGGIITNAPFAWGYADSGSPDFLQVQQVERRGYNPFDIAWAVNPQGQPVTLSHIDFVKVYTGQNCDGNPFGNLTDPRARYLGEVSTEVGGAIDIALH